MNQRLAVADSGFALACPEGLEPPTGPVADRANAGPAGRAGPRVRKTRELGIGGHQSAKIGRDEWLTPPHVLSALGPFDLDPCAPLVRPWPTATHHYTAADNGLAKPWAGRVWLNPPYGQETARWMERLANHGNGVALIFARTETAIFFPWVWGCASAVLFLKGRLHFHYTDGSRAKANSGAPSALVAYGTSNARQLSECGLQGAFLALRAS